jgi:hypothetical protein
VFWFTELLLTRKLVRRRIHIYFDSMAVLAALYRIILGLGMYASAGKIK